MKIATLALGSIFILIVTLPSAAFLYAPSNVHQREKWLRVASYSSLPEDGTPQFTSIRFARQDAWTRMPEETIGHVFLRRSPDIGEVVALKIHHSRGAAVVYDSEKRLFRCACWGVEFDLNGKPLEEKYSALAPGIDRVETKVQRGEVFVRVSDGE